MEKAGRGGEETKQTREVDLSPPPHAEPHPDGPEESHEGYAGVEAGTDMGIS